MLIQIDKPKRACGDCTLCCKLVAVRELKKPAEQKCDHCIKGSGCQIYSIRPQGCVDFECLWLTGEIPELLFPKEVKIVLQWDSDEKDRFIVAHLDPMLSEIPKRVRRHFDEWLSKVSYIVCTQNGRNWLYERETEGCSAPQESKGRIIA